MEAICSGGGISLMDRSLSMIELEAMIIGFPAAWRFASGLLLMSGDRALVASIIWEILCHPEVHRLVKIV